MINNEFMKRLFALSLVGTSFLIGLNRLKAEDYDAFGIDYSRDPSIGNRVYGVDSATGSKTFLSTKVFEIMVGLLGNLS